MDGVRLTRLSLDLAILCEVDPDGISSQSRVRFRSGRLWRPERHGACLLAWSLLFYFCQRMARVILLVFLLVSAAINDKNYFKFKWLWNQAVTGQKHQAENHNNNNNLDIGLIPDFRKNFHGALKTRIKIRSSRPFCWHFLLVSGEQMLTANFRYSEREN